MLRWPTALSAVTMVAAALILSAGHLSLDPHPGIWPPTDDLVVSAGVAIAAIAGFGVATARLSGSTLAGALLASAAFLSTGGIAVMTGDHSLPIAPFAIAIGLATISNRFATVASGLAVAATCRYADAQLALVLVVPLTLTVSWLRRSLSWMAGTWLVAAGVIGVAAIGHLPVHGQGEFATLRSLIGACGTGSGIGLVLTCVGLAILAPLPWRAGGAIALILALVAIALVLRAPLIACMALAITAAHLARQAAKARGRGLEIVAGIAAIFPSAPYVLGLSRGFYVLLLPSLAVP